MKHSAGEFGERTKCNCDAAYSAKVVHEVHRDARVTACCGLTPDRLPREDRVAIRPWSGERATCPPAVHVDAVRRPDVRADGRAGGGPMTTQPDPTAVEVWADVAALLNDRAQMWEAEPQRGHQARASECRELANAFRTYAEGVGIPSMQSLREKRRAAEAACARVAALGDALHASTVGPVHECGTFIREAIAGTLDAEELATFLEARR